MQGEFVAMEDSAYPTSRRITFGFPRPRNIEITAPTGGADGVVLQAHRRLSQGCYGAIAPTRGKKHTVGCDVWGGA